MYQGSITDVSGLLVGCAQGKRTGCSVILAPGGAICGVDVRGSAPGTRETSFMDQAKSVQHANAVLLTGGSAFGLAAADGVMRYCEEHGNGVRMPEACVPIVPAAVIYDLAYSKNARPDAALGYQACQAACTQVQQGCFGAGCGATIGKLLGMEYAAKGGVGTASLLLSDGCTVGAYVCVNAAGNVLDRNTIMGGAQQNGEFVDLEAHVLQHGMSHAMGLSNTTIGVVATDAALDKDGVTKLAQSAQNGLARSISPSHMMIDGDTVFALSYGGRQGELNALAVAAAEVMRRAIVNAILAVQAI